MYVLVSNYSQTTEYKKSALISVDICSSKNIFSIKKLTNILSSNAHISKFLNSNECSYYFIDAHIRAETLFGICRATIKLSNDFATEVCEMIEKLLSTQYIQGELQIGISIIRIKYIERFATLLVLDDKLDFIQNSWTCKKRKGDKINVNDIIKHIPIFPISEFHQMREVIFNCIPDIDIPDI